MTVSQQIQDFSDRFGKNIIVAGVSWRYYQLGAGPPVFWLTGGLRRAALGFAFMEKLAAQHTVIAPDYPPVHTVAEFTTAFDAILQAESVTTFVLAGQSYGGLLAQAYLAHRPQSVERLVLSSSGPASYGKLWLPVEYLLLALARILPERVVKRLLGAGLSKAFTLPAATRAEWAAVLDAILSHTLTRADVVSHFAVAANLIWRETVRPAAYQHWRGPVLVLAAENDPTQSVQDIAQYEKLFGRPVAVLSLGDMGHTAALFDPDRYVALLEQALSHK